MKTKITLFLLVFTLTLTASEVKFGKVSEEELKEEFCEMDSEASAAILYKDYRVFYIFDADNGFELVTEVFERIKIYDLDGLDYATIEVPLYNSNNGRETIGNIKGFTHNFVNGQTARTKLEKSGIFYEEVTDFWEKTKITFPNVKVGSIVEYKYQIKSPFIYKIDEMPVQYDIPVRDIHIKTRIPEYFVHKPLIKGYYSLDIDTSKEFKRTTYTYKRKEMEAGLGRSNDNGYERRVFEYFEHISEVSMKNIPALRTEAHVSNVDNYRAALSFEITSLVVPGLIQRNFSQSWGDVARYIYSHSSFISELKKTNYFARELSEGLTGVQDDFQKMDAVLNFVKRKVKWNSFYGALCRQGVRNAYEQGSGNSAELNLMLVAMLKYSGLEAYPVLVSTRNHGIPMFPDLGAYNYVVACTKIQGSYYLLDATSPFSTANVLPLRTLNWFGRIIGDDGSVRIIDLMPKEKSMDAKIMNVELKEDGSFSGRIRESLTNNNALHFRNVFNSSTEDVFLKDLENEYVSIEILNYELKNNLHLYKPVVQSYEFKSDEVIEKIGEDFYFSPFFHLELDENPFKVDKREYPVDFGYPWEDSFLINVEIPEGYTVKSIPKPMAVALPNNLGLFKYNISHTGNRIHLKSKIAINTPIVNPNLYGALKEFFDQLVEKQSEKVVLSKI